MLRLAPGNDIRMYFGNQSAGAGILMATGDATQPIVFTSAAGTPAAGDWAGLLLLSSYGSQLSHVTIEYAGGELWLGLGKLPALGVGRQCCTE